MISDLLRQTYAAIVNSINLATVSELTTQKKSADTNFHVNWCDSKKQLPKTD